MSITVGKHALECHIGVHESNVSVAACVRGTENFKSGAHGSTHKGPMTEILVLKAFFFKYRFLFLESMASWVFYFSYDYDIWILEVSHLLWNLLGSFQLREVLMARRSQKVIIQI